MKSKYVTMLLLIFIFIVSAVVVGRAIMSADAAAIEDSLVKSMESTKAQVMESTISVWSKINNKFLTADQVDKELKTIILGIDPDKSTINIVRENSDEINKQSMSASRDNKHYFVAVESIKTDKGGETYVVMDVAIDQSSKELAAERQRLESYFQDKSIKPNVSSCIVGVYDGKLTEADMSSKLADAMSSVKAKTVEGLNEEGLSSISAYSGNINNFVLSNNKKVNMQIAIRYSSYDDKTYIWIGSPLIHMEY